MTSLIDVNTDLLYAIDEFKPDETTFHSLFGEEDKFTVSDWNFEQFFEDKLKHGATIENVRSLSHESVCQREHVLGIVRKLRKCLAEVRQNMLIIYNAKTNDTAQSD